MELPVVPHQLLRDAPLVGGGWPGMGWLWRNGELGAVNVSCLSSYLEGYQYRDEDEAAVEERRRESLLEPLTAWKPGRRGNYRF
jgi:hypothetical protein